MTGLLQADAVELPVADDTVDLVVTSPPYFALRSYQDDGEHYDGQIGSEATPQDFLDALWTVTRECARVLKPSGSLWVNLGDKYANPAGSGASGWEGGSWDRSKPQKAQNTLGMGVRQKSLMGLPWRYAIGCIDDLGLILRAEVIWSKPNGLPESVTDRVRRSHEQWFHFTLEPRYFSAIDEIREEPLTYSTASGSVRYRRDGEGFTEGLADTGHAYTASENAHITGRRAVIGEFIRTNDPLGKVPGSVWSIPSEPLRVPDDLGVDHFAAFPQEWPRRLILGWCPAEVCTACGQGRAPVSDRTVEKWQTGHKKTDSDSTQMGGGRAMTANRDNGPLPNTVTHTITGYACACPDNSAPSTPGVVLDPFAGTGTVPMVARALGRTGIGVDLSSDYLRLAAWRVFESGHASKTVARTNGERQGLLL